MRLDRADRHRHDDRPHETGHAAETHVERREHEAHHAVQRDDTAWRGFPRLADQVRGGAFQTIAFQGAHHEQDDDEDRHASVAYERRAECGQEPVDADPARQRSDDGRDEYDEDGVELQRKTDNNNQNA